MPDLDLGFNGNAAAASQEPVADLDTGKVTDTTLGGADATNLSNDKGTNTPTSNSDNADPNSTKVDNNSTVDNDNKDDNKEDKIELTSGMTVTVGEDIYTVDNIGNLIDKDNKIFKEAKDVQDFIKGFEINENDETSVVDINAIIQSVGIDITDENDKPITFENTPEGIASYVNNVIELQRDEYAKAGVEKLIEQYPIVSDFLSYYIANGNSFEGFGETKDRSNINIDENNIAQQEAIVREAFKEFNRHGDVEAYIKYLKDSNTLLDVSKSELAGLQQADKEFKEAQTKQAEEQLRIKQENEIAYWNNVKQVVDNKVIAGYKIPDTILINKNGKQVAATPNDFFNYLYQVDKNGYSAYERELASIDKNEELQDELLRAYLRFTGGTYSNLIDMAVAAKETKNLRLKYAEQKRKTTITIGAPKKTKNIADNINDVLGY